MAPTTFDIIPPTRPLTGRDISAARKNYLEMYAKRRANGERTALSTIPLAQAGIDVVPHPRPYAAIQEAATAVSSESLWQTLVSRHQAAVAAAPDAEETVITSLLSPETSNLFEDTFKPLLQADTASSHHIRTIVMSALICGVLAAAGYGVIHRQQLQKNYQLHAAPTVRAPVPAQPKLVNSAVLVPQNLRIGSVAINAPVLSLGTTPAGAIDVPKAWNEVGWYNKSSYPGMPGPAVLVGHFASGQGAVFDNLGSVKIGDTIVVSNSHGQTFAYRVTEMNEYDRGQVPMQTILKKGDAARLEVITCAGAWDSTTYAKRLVVTAQLVN